MSSFPSFLEGFSTDLYLSTLVAVAHSDGLHPSEEAFLKQQAENFGLDLATLPEPPHDLSQLPWATRILVYRDALMLAYADGQLNENEQNYLSHLAQRMQLQPTKTKEVEDWVNDYSNLLNRFDTLVQEPG